METKGKERGILKLEPRPRVVVDTRSELTPQGSCDRPPSSPQPSVDRLSVTWAEPGSMTSSGVNLFHLPSETPISNEVKFSPTAGDGSEDEDYSASLSAVLRQRRASVRRSRKGRGRRPSSPFVPEETRSRRRSSIFTTSSGDTAISMEEGMSQEQIFENIHLHKEVLGSVKQQPLGMRRKLKIVHQAKTYIKRHEGQLQERLAQSKSTRDIYARFNILLATKWQQLKREATNTSNLLIPWELRIKEIESHFGSVVASYFTFLRWLFWVNLVIGFILFVFVIVPEYLTANPKQDGERKEIMKEELQNATNLLTLWEFEGALKYSPIFYGYYSNIEKPEYKMPLAYFLTGLVVYVYSFVAILRKMAENSRMSKLSEKEDECIFSWKLFTGWDFMIGNAETAHNRIASVVLGFKEALLEEAEKKKDLGNWRIISLRAFVNICVIIFLVISALAVVTVVSRTDDNDKGRSWWHENETTIVVTVITTTFPLFFEMLGYLEHYHPRKQLRLQLARIMLLNLLNLYSLIFALFSKIEGMSNELVSLKPNLTSFNTTSPTVISNNVSNITEPTNVHTICFEEMVICLPCIILLTIPVTLNKDNANILRSTVPMPLSDTSKPTKINKIPNMTNIKLPKILIAENLLEKDLNNISDIDKELNRLRYIGNQSNSGINEEYDTTSEINYTDYTFYYGSEESISTTNTDTTDTNSAEDEMIYKSSSETNTLASTASNDEIATLVESEELAYTGISSTFSEIALTSTDFTSTYQDRSTTNVVTDSATDPGIYITTDRSNNTLSSVNDSDFFYIDNDSTVTSGLTSESSFYETKSIMYTDSVTILSDDILSTITYTNAVAICPYITFNYTVNCKGHNITQSFVISNCSIMEKKCYETKCQAKNESNKDNERNGTNTAIDIVYMDNNRKIYNLTLATRKKLLKLCWETMFGQELVKLTMMDLVFVLLGTLFMDFFRALLVKYLNRCWCWDLEKKYPKYGDFKIAENILHLINNQGMVWMGMFFSPGLVVLNVFKLIIMMYLRSWAVITCNVPHEVVFRVSKSNNFYLALLLTMLFLCVLPVGYSIVCVKPSWHCGPFSEYERIYYILTNNISNILPKRLNFALEYIASPAIVIPLLVLLILIIYYLTSLTNSLREANNDLKIQLRRERTEERRKMFQLADTRRRGGSSAMDNTPFARWKKALPSLPISKSIDSDERKGITGEDIKETTKLKRKGGIFAKIVGMALDKKVDEDSVNEYSYITPSPNNVDDETDTDFHETLPKDILKIKDITILKNNDLKKGSCVEFKTIDDKFKPKKDENLSVKLERLDDKTEKKAMTEKHISKNEYSKIKPKIVGENIKEIPEEIKKSNRRQTSQSSTQSKQSDSISSVIPVITISTTESDEDILQTKKKNFDDGEITGSPKDATKGIIKRSKKYTSDLKSLQRQSSVDSINDQKAPKEKKPDEGHKYQYSL